MTKKILVIPGAYDMVKNYGGYPGIDIWMRETVNDAEKLKQADWIIAASSGFNYVVSFPLRSDQKFILINPLIKQRSQWQLVIRAIKFVIFKEKNEAQLIPMSRYWFALNRAKQIAKVNVLEGLKKLPKENIFIIRGLRDSFFCDEESVDIIKREGFKLIEVDAEHVWNQNIARTVANIINNNDEL